MNLDVNHTKVLLEYEGSEPGTLEIESVWALKVPDGFKVDNIPFFAMNLAVGDIVSAEPDLDGLLRFRSLVRSSGHSTVRLWFAAGNEVAKARAKLSELGCTSEQCDLPRLVAVDVPPSAPRNEVWAFLDDGERRGIFEYEEACLGNNAP